jgi:peptide deformylase
VAELEIVTLGAPVLHEPGRELSAEEIASPEVQALIDEMIETMRAANGAGLAANQVGTALRVAIAEVEEGNPRYPYKPPIPLTVMINPAFEINEDDEVELINEGCLSLPDVRAEVPRHMSITVRYRDRHGDERVERKRGLTAGTFQHEIDHLEGTLITDRADAESVTTWEEYERSARDGFERRAGEIVARYGE